MAGRVQQLFINYLKRSFNWDEDQGDMLWSRTFNFQQFATAAATFALDVTSFNGAVEIRGAYLWLIQNFTGGAVATATFSVGTTGTPTLYVNAGNVFAGAPIVRVGVNIVAPGTFLNAANPNQAGTVRFTLTVTGANTNVLTQGSVHVKLILAAAKLRLATPTG